MNAHSLKALVTTLGFAMTFGAAASAFADAVTIRDPAFGLPHVCGDTDANAAREQGYQAVVDRMGQFLIVLRAARGTLHQGIGLLADFSEDDLETRLNGYSRNELNNMYNLLPASSQALLDAYGDGVNEAIADMMKAVPVLEPAFELLFFRQSAVVGSANLFGNAPATPLTQFQGGDPNYIAPGGGPYPAGGFQFTPEMAMGFAVLQVRQFGFEAWDEVGMADDLVALINQYGAGDGTDLWDDRHWKNDPLAPVSVPDSRTPGYGGPLSRMTDEQKIEIAKAADELTDKLHGRIRLPGYPQRDYSKALEPRRIAQANRERHLREWGAWPALGSYAWMIAPGRSASSNPWIGGFPQTGIQVPSIMHYSELRGDTISANGMFFISAPFALIGHNDNTAYTTTTAHLKIVDFYIEELVGGNFNVLKYDNHGTTADMAKRVELIHNPVGGPTALDVFRTNVTTSVNGANAGDRIVQAFAGDHAGTAESGSGTMLTDDDASFSAGALIGGHIALVQGTGAGQIRAISGNTTDTVTVGVAWATAPDDGTEYVIADPGSVITAVALESVANQGEATTALGFSRFQTANDILDIRAGVRMIPSTHNFYAADNSAYNGVGTNTGTGNIFYGTSGFKRVRQVAVDDRLPLDGTAAQPFVIVDGTVGSAGANTLVDVGAFTGLDLSNAAINFTYDNPDDNGSEYIVAILAGDGAIQVRRIEDNTDDDTLMLEEDWGTIPSAGDAYAVYEIWAMPEAINPVEGFSANWNNKQLVANDIMLGGSGNGRNHRAELLLEQLSLDASVDRADQRNLNKFVAGVENPGTAGRYLLTRLNQAIGATSDCGTIDDELNTNNAFPERGRVFENPLIVPPDGTTVPDAIESLSQSYIRGWATELASDIYGDEYGPAGVSLLTSSSAIGWVLHAIDEAAGQSGVYSNAYTSDYFNGGGWEQVVRDSFCDYAAANPVVGTKNRDMRQYNHPLAALPCSQGCFTDDDGNPISHRTPIEFDPTPDGNRGTWEQIVEVGPTVTGEFIFPMGQSGHIVGNPAGFSGSFIKQSLHTATMQPLWRDWRFAPMLHVCEDVTFGGDEDGDTDNDGVVDGFEKHYYAGSLANDGSSDTDGDGADLATEWRWGSDPTVADTDGDTIPDGADVSPQDRLCVKGELKKLGVKDSSKAGKDKVSMKWEVPLNVCVGSDYETPCTTDTDCGVAGDCRRIHVNPQLDPVRVLAADDTPLFDGDIPISAALWKNKNFEKFSYADKDGVNGPVSKIKVSIKDKKNSISLQWQAKGFDMAAGPDVGSGVGGMMIGTRCFMETTTNCSVAPGKLSCKANP